MFAPTISLMSIALLFFVSRGQLATLSTTEGSSSNGSKMPNNNPLTSHVLDTSLGKPASGILVNLYKMDFDRTWKLLNQQLTNNDGRIGNLLKAEEFTSGTYKLHFDTKTYFTVLNQKTFYPYIEVVFEIENPEEHYHVPILLNGYGFSTYRGS